jgi:uncharacterized protein YcfJ
VRISTVLIAGVLALGSAYSLADHRGHGYRDHQHCQHHAAKHLHKCRKHRNAYRERQVAEYGRVLSVEPVYRYYTQPVSNHGCRQYDHRAPNYTSFAGTVLGAVVGGALGHRIGDAHGDPEVAAVAGGLLGAAIGRDIDRRAQYYRGMRVDGPCRVSHGARTRRELVEYRVSYRYNGRVHTTTMDHDPGEWVELNVDITPA